MPSRTRKPAAPSQESASPIQALQRPAAEVLYAEELQRLAVQDGDTPRPGNWQLTPLSVLKFILGDADLNIAPKFVGSRSMLERCIVALATNRGLMLIGKTSDGKAIEPLSTVMSTAEAVSVGYAAGIHAYYYNDGNMAADHLVQSLLGSAIKDTPEDLKKLKHYFNQVVKDRKGDRWRQYYDARRHLL